MESLDYYCFPKNGVSLSNNTYSCWCTYSWIQILYYQLTEETQHTRNRTPVGESNRVTFWIETVNNNIPWWPSYDAVRSTFNVYDVSRVAATPKKGWRCPSTSKNLGTFLGIVLDKKATPLFSRKFFYLEHLNRSTSREILRWVGSYLACSSLYHSKRSIPKHTTRWIIGIDNRSGFTWFPYCRVVVVNIKHPELFSQDRRNVHLPSGEGYVGSVTRIGPSVYVFNWGRTRSIIFPPFSAVATVTSIRGNICRVSIPVIGFAPPSRSGYLIVEFVVCLMTAAGLEVKFYIR